jgi:hypothetical protein
MKTLTILILLSATLAPTIPAHAFIIVRRPVVVVPYPAPVVVYGAPAPAVVYDASAPPVMLPSPTPIGSVSYALPPGAQSANIKGVQYYVAGPTYYRPNFGPNGVYYVVVANPNAPAATPPGTPIGSIFQTLPAGAQSTKIGGVEYYVAGNTYYLPHFWANGVYYEVVANPGGCGNAC